MSSAERPPDGGASSRGGAVSGRGAGGGVAPALRVAVIGAGWAGCAAAVRAVQLGHAVQVFETAHEPGGRARRIDMPGWPQGAFDNGQHILIGAYRCCLDLMRTVGADPQALLWRQPLTVTYPDGRGLRLPDGAPPWDALRGLAGFVGWTARERLAMLTAAAGWALRRFRCQPQWSVGHLTRRLPAAVRRDFIDPLCVAALNTPSSQASAQVFLRVLHDTLLGGSGASNLLLPRTDLGGLFPRPALTWLRARGAMVHAGRRVLALEPDGAGWRVDGEHHDRVILACPPWEAARLAQPIAPAWAAGAGALRFEPIVTVYARGRPLDVPMLALPVPADSEKRGPPAQFVFDRGRLGGPQGLLAFVVSGAAAWAARGLAATSDAVVVQAEQALGQTVEPVKTVIEKRATFLCTPGLQRPPMDVAPGLRAAGDYVQGPYPATLEGAVRSGWAAAGGD